MNATSACPADARADAAPPRPVLIWDLPVRVFHWSMVACFAGAWLTSESESWRLVHVTLGWTLGALVLFRLMWGLIGSRHARFTSFVRGPAAVKRYLGSLLRGRPEAHAGHNPAGALAIVGLLALGVVTVASGWATYEDIGPGLLEELHEGAASAMLALVGLHVAAVIGSSLLHRENLVRSMWTGRKQAPATEAIRRDWRALAAAMLLAIAGFWGWQWYDAPQAASAQADAAEAPSRVGPPGAARALAGRAQDAADHDDDD